MLVNQMSSERFQIHVLVKKLSYQWHKNAWEISTEERWTTTSVWPWPLTCYDLHRDLRRHCNLVDTHKYFPSFYLSIPDIDNKWSSYFANNWNISRRTKWHAADDVINYYHYVTPALIKRSLARSQFNDSYSGNFGSKRALKHSSLCTEIIYCEMKPTN
jgi:hypothetical protein